MSVQNSSIKHYTGLMQYWSCIDTTSNKKQRVVTQKIIKVFSRIAVFIRRFFFLLIFREWFTNKKADRIVKFYIMRLMLIKKR